MNNTIKTLRMNDVVNDNFDKVLKDCNTYDKSGCGTNENVKYRLKLDPHNKQSEYNVTADTWGKLSEMPSGIRQVFTAMNKHAVGTLVVDGLGLALSKNPVWFICHNDECSTIKITAEKE